MKTKLLIANSALLLFMAGLYTAIGGDMKAGAILVLLSSALLAGIYLQQLIQSYKHAKLWCWQTLATSGLLLVLAIIYIHGFSAAIGMGFLYQVKLFTRLYFVAGFMMPILFLYISIAGASRADKKWLLVGASSGTLLCLAGFLGYARLAPFPVALILNSWVVLLLFYLVFLTKRCISGQEKAEKRESLLLLLTSFILFGFWLFRFIIPPEWTDGATKLITHLGFVPIILLPLAVLLVRKLYAYPAFLFFFILMDLFFIQFNDSFNYLVGVGLNGCVGYDQARDHIANTDPGVPLAELMKTPTQNELDQIRLEWQDKDFSPQGIEVVHKAAMANGDSIKVIAHLVNGLKHYGAIRIPKNLDVKKAPILMELEGGGTGLDIAKLTTLTQGKCRAQKNKFISILPSYRGCIIRGKGFCFRSEGYFGDPWLGPAEDATALLEAVKEIYNKPNDTKVLAMGISRGATVALIIGGLTKKLDYIIATSTHTKFLDEHVVKNERVGKAFARAFYTPTTSPEQIRKRIIASSPYYFVDKLPPFDLHQGANDDRTTIWHVDVLSNKLKEIGKDTSTYNLYIYEDKGHGYDDDRTVCQSLEAFVEAMGAK